MKTQLFRNEGFRFIIKFLLLLALLYYSNLFFISITAKGGNAFYIFLKQDLDYIDWLRYSILHVSKVIANFLGIPSKVESEYIIRLTESKKGLRMVYKCVGYGVMSFWGAFVLANKDSLFKKLSWLLIGWVSIWAINCMRVILLLTALKNNWPISPYFDHHTLFNIAAYGFIFLLIYVYTRYDKTIQ